MAKKELSSEMRVVLAFGLSLLILIGSRFFLVQEAPPGEKPAQQPAPAPATSAPPETPAPETPAVQPETKETPPSEPADTSRVVQGEREEQIVVVSDLYRVVFSTRGAVVKSWQLQEFKDAKKGPLELLNADAAREFGWPLMFWTTQQDVRDQVNNALFVSSGKGEVRAPATLTFEYSSGGITARKQLVFSNDRYDIALTTSLERDDNPITHQIAWRGSFGDVHDAASRGTMVDVFLRENQSITRLQPTNLAQEGFWGGLFRGVGETIGLREETQPTTEVTREGQIEFAGIEDHFFTATALPDGKPLRVTAFSHEISGPDESRKQPSIGFAVGTAADARSQFRLYVGPKDAATLAQAKPELAELVDYGFFSIVATPLYHGLRWIHDHIVANYGWAIILLTLAINLALMPLKLSSLRSAKKMQAIAPQLRAIQEKYKGLKVNDPKRQQMSQETMQLYQKHGVNPVGGCLPLLIQLPFLIGFYNVLSTSLEMRQAEWISPWISDLSSPESLPIKILPLVMCASQFVMQKMTPMPGVDPVQQKIMLLMPVIFLTMFYNQASGLVLYWTVGNLVGIGQQWYFNRTHTLQQVEARQAKKKQKTKK